MKVSVAVGLILGFAAGAAGQYGGRIQGGGAGPRTYGSPHGFGNVLFPGTGTAPETKSHPFSISDPSFAGRLFGTVSGFGPYTGAPVGGNRGAVRAGYVPYAVPIYVGGYGYPYQAEPQVVVMNPPLQQPAPQVIINQYYTPDAARPVVREYTEDDSRPSGIRVYEAPSSSAPPGPTARPQDRPTIYLIAFRDNSVQSALAYWMEGDTLHYVTVQGSHNKASLDLVDREFSEQLNRERQLEFRLPAK